MMQSLRNACRVAGLRARACGSLRSANCSSATTISPTAVPPTTTSSSSSSSSSASSCTDVSSKSASDMGSIKAQWRKRRNDLFDAELSRQQSDTGRIEKIKVKYFPPSIDSDSTINMAMNRHLSTPADCARHLSRDVYETGALALVNGQPWDMTRPLVEDCDLSILTMKTPEKFPSINKIFWRTCSFVLGAMIESSFKDNIQMYLHSFPVPNVKSGSYTYDVILDLPDWKPTNAELRAMSAQFVKITNQMLPLARLEVTESLALDMFQDNPFKSKQIPDIAASNNGVVTLYRIGEHIDISKGPMVSHTGIIGKTTMASVHRIESEDSDHMYRFQGVSLPRGCVLNHFAFGILEERARTLNSSVWIPNKQLEELPSKEKISLAAQN